MKHLATKTLVTALCLVSGSACAMTGNELLKKLQSMEPSAILEGHAYIRGILDSEATFYTIEKFRIARTPGAKNETDFFCITEAATAGGTAAKVAGPITQKLLADSQTRQQTANVLVRRALIEAWPCADNPKKAQ
jgi:hypothetical protein